MPPTASIISVKTRDAVFVIALPARRNEIARVRGQMRVDGGAARVLVALRDLASGCVASMASRLLICARSFHICWKVLPCGAGKSRYCVQPEASGTFDKRPLPWPRLRQHARCKAGAELIEPRALGEEGPELRPQRMAAGCRCCSNSFSRQCRIIFGSGMRIGQTSSQRPQKVEALGRCLAFSMPISAGVTTAPIGPG